MEPHTLAANELPRKLGMLDATVMIIGIVIGSGIFVLPNLIARDLPSAPAILSVWIVSGILSFFGALAYAELGAMMPATGGHYVYLREAYGPLCAFVCGWTFMLAVLSGGTAWLAVTFSIYVAHFIPLTFFMSKIVSLALLSGLVRREPDRCAGRSLGAAYIYCSENSGLTHAHRGSDIKHQVRHTPSEHSPATTVILDSFRSGDGCLPDGLQRLELREFHCRRSERAAAESAALAGGRNGSCRAYTS